MLRVLATTLAVLALTTSYHSPTSQALTPGITLIGKGDGHRGPVSEYKHHAA